LPIRRKKNSLTSAQCPECNTRFKVTAEQLSGHQGKVRCGVCRAVFNAQAQLSAAEFPISNDTNAHHLALDTKLSAPIHSGKTTSVRWPWLTGIALTVLLLISQISYFYRVELSAQLPGLKPILQNYCQLLNCSIPLPQHIKELTIESSEMSQDAQQPNLTQLNFLLHNGANFSQAYPAIELTFWIMKKKLLLAVIFNQPLISSKKATKKSA